MKPSNYWKVVPLATVWVGVLIISLVSPDFISGSEQEKLPLVGLTAWIFGIGATKAIMSELVKIKGKPADTKWKNSTVLIMVVWAIAVIVATNSPIWETGSDPTRIPVAALLASPVAAAVTDLIFKYADLFYNDSKGEGQKKSLEN